MDATLITAISTIGLGSVLAVILIAWLLTRLIPSLFAEMKADREQHSNDLKLDRVQRDKHMKELYETSNGNRDHLSAKVDAVKGDTNEILTTLKERRQ